MSWDVFDDADREYDFLITCPQCGRERSNLDGGPCACGSSAESYDSADAARWNRHLDRERR